MSTSDIEGKPSGAAVRRDGETRAQANDGAPCAAIEGGAPNAAGDAGDIAPCGVETATIEDGAGTAIEVSGGRKPGPRMTPEERSLLLKLLVAGEREGAIVAVFRARGYEPPSSSTCNYYRNAYREQIEAARARRTEAALTEGLALRAERVARLKEHAEVLDELRFVPDRNGRLWNERAWRQTLADIAAEMGERRPAEGADGTETVKVIIGIDPDRV